MVKQDAAHVDIATIVCVCGISRKLRGNDSVELARHHGWRYVRRATGGNAENGFDFEGMCPECVEMDSDGELDHLHGNPSA